MPPSVPSTAYFTVTCRPLAADSDTVKSRFVVPLSPSDTLASPIDTVGGSSSSVIVPTPVAAVDDRTALTGPLSVSRTVSSASSSVSPVTDTVIVLLVSPAAKVSVVSLTAS